MFLSVNLLCKETVLQRFQCVVILNHRVGIWTQDTMARIILSAMCTCIPLYLFVCIHCSAMFASFESCICVATEYSACHVRVYCFRDVLLCSWTIRRLCVCVCLWGGGVRTSLHFWESRVNPMKCEIHPNMSTSSSWITKLSACPL
jgi:hypothetical protein